MTPSPIAKALSTLLKHRTKFLLMGGQACIVYGAAEFSRDIDLAVFISPSNIRELRASLSDLQAESVFVPELSEKALRDGHACHFRCQAEEVAGLRIDIMGRLRGLESFRQLWQRRQEVRLPEVGIVPVMSVEDLVRAKKTQRDKDWPMIRRLVEADVYRAGENASLKKVYFWLAECRTPELLVDLAGQFGDITRKFVTKRPLLQHALAGETPEVARLLLEEQQKEQELDKKYWAPLRKELERWRRRRTQRKP